MDEVKVTVVILNVPGAEQNIKLHIQWQNYGRQQLMHCSIEGNGRGQQFYKDVPISYVHAHVIINACTACSTINCSL